MIEYKKYKTFFWSVLLFHCSVICAQQKTDSLLNILQANTVDTVKINTLNELGFELRSTNPKQAIEYTSQAMELAEKLQFLKGVAVANVNAAIIQINLGDYEKAATYAERGILASQKIKDRFNEAKGYNALGESHRYKDEYNEALKNYDIAYKIRKDINDEKGIGSVLNNFGIVYFNQGNYTKALSNHFEALRIREKLKDMQGVAASYNNIALVYLKQLNFDEAQKNNEAALRIREQQGDKRGVATSYTNIANVLKVKGDYSSAIGYYEKALQLFLKIDDKKNVAGSYNNIGCILENQAQVLIRDGKNGEALEKIEKAIQNFTIAEKQYNEVQSTTGLILISENMGQVYLMKKNHKKAKDYFLRGLELSQKIGSKEEVKNFYFDLSKTDSCLGNFEEAFKHYKLYISERDSLINEENTKKTVQIQMQYEFDKKEAAAKLEQEKKDAVSIAEKKKQQIIIVLVSFVLLLVMIFAVFISRSLNTTKKQKSLIEAQKQEVELQKQIVEEKQKEIIDSINYARRIQSSILPNEQYIARVLSRTDK